MLQSKWGRRLSFGYLGIFLLAAAFAAYLFIFDPANSEFAGLYAFLVAMPWSIFFAPVLGMAAPFLGAFINVIILFYLGKFLDKALDNENSRIEMEMPFLQNNVTAWKKFNIFFWIILLLSVLLFFSAFLSFEQLKKYITFITVLSFIAKIGGIFVLSYFGYILKQKKEYLLLGLLALLPSVFSVVGLIIGYIILLQGRKKSWQGNSEDNEMKNSESNIIFSDKSEKNKFETEEDNRKKFKLLIYGIILIAVVGGVTMYGKFYHFGDTKGLYSAENGKYKNKKFGFQLNVPIDWKSYSVQEAINCPIIKSEYADDYYLLASPTANYNETFFVINKASLSPDYFANSPMDQVRQQIKGKGIDENMVIAQNPGLLDEQKKYEAEIGDYEKLNINGFTVYRKDYNVGDSYREDNYFVSNGALINVFYYVPKSEGELSELMKSMRGVFDKTLAKY